MFQTHIFDEIDNDLISIEKAAEIAKVSTATIRNWIKAKYIINDKKYVNKSSLLLFMAKNTGEKKLAKRANKLNKDEHNHELLTAEIAAKTNLAAVKDTDLGINYENNLSESYKNKEGIYYTPAHIITDMFSSISGDMEGKLFLDPCCGAGNFILAAIKLGFKPKNVYGFDTDINAVLISKKRIFDQTGFKTNNIIAADFLTAANHLQQKFDFIFTNPPWGKKIDKELKEKYTKMYKMGKIADTSGLFLLASLNRLADGGKLGFLLPEAFFNIATFEQIRKKYWNYQ